MGVLEVPAEEIKNEVRENEPLILHETLLVTIADGILES